MADKFSNEPWDAAAVARNLEATDYCQCCLIDVNSKGVDKVKGHCYLPVRKTPDGPYNRAALRAAMGGHGIFRVKGVPAAMRKKAARRLVGLARGAGITVASGALLRLAGMKA
jgi:hypothetical protein